MTSFLETYSFSKTESRNRYFEHIHRSKTTSEKESPKLSTNKSPRPDDFNSEFN